MSKPVFPWGLMIGALAGVGVAIVVDPLIESTPAMFLLGIGAIAVGAVAGAMVHLFFLFRKLDRDFEELMKVLRKYGR